MSDDDIQALRKALSKVRQTLAGPAMFPGELDRYHQLCSFDRITRLLDEVERLRAELAICRDAIEAAYDVVDDWPKNLDSDGDMAVRRTTLRRLNEAVGKAAPRLLYERPEGQHLYGLHYRDLMAERDALREDAERYRWLRHGDNDECAIESVYPFSMWENTHWIKRGKKLDDAIDAARKDAT